MAQTAAQRQAAYRNRRLKAVDAEFELLNTMVSIQAKRKLERLAVFFGIPQRRVIENVLANAERFVLDNLPADQHTAYYEKRLTRR
jgi:hypothetical protein